MPDSMNDLFNFKIPENMRPIGVVYSNLMHDIKDDKVHELQKGDCWAEHTAWNFFGAIWFSNDEKKWNELVMHHHVNVDLIVGDTIESVIDKANERWGST